MYSKLQRRRHSFSALRAHGTAAGNGGESEASRKEALTSSGGYSRKKALQRPQSTITFPVAEADPQIFRHRLMSDDTPRLVSSGGSHNDRGLGKDGRKKSLKNILKLKKRKKSKAQEIKQDHNMQVTNIAG